MAATEEALLGCTYQILRCSCGSLLGKTLRSTVSAWDLCRDSWLLDARALITYEWGAAVQSEGPRPLSLVLEQELLPAQKKALPSRHCIYGVQRSKGSSYHTTVACKS